jgi:hypothetical protein
MGCAADQPQRPFVAGGGLTRDKRGVGIRGRSRGRSRHPRLLEANPRRFCAARLPKLAAPPPSSSPPAAALCAAPASASRAAAARAPLPLGPRRASAAADRGSALAQYRHQSSSFFFLVF